MITFEIADEERRIVRVLNFPGLLHVRTDGMWEGLPLLWNGDLTLPTIGGVTGIGMDVMELRIHSGRLPMQDQEERDRIDLAWRLLSDPTSGATIKAGYLKNVVRFISLIPPEKYLPEV